MRSIKAFSHSKPETTNSYIIKLNTRKTILAFSKTSQAQAGIYYNEYLIAEPMSTWSDKESALIKRVEN